MDSSLPRMNWPAQCATIIPCLNESAAIGPLVAAVRQYLPAVIVIDDGSSDDTAALAKNAGAEVVRHANRQGKGVALQTGWQLARERGFPWALSMDGDGQHAPEDITAFLSCAENISADLVIGNRMGDQQRMPWLRRQVNRWMSARISNLAGQNLPDSQCGFRLMNLETWAALPIDAGHFEIESELLLAFARAGRRIEFVPVEVIYRTERSKIHPWRDTVRWFKWWQRVRGFQNVYPRRALETRTVTADSLPR
jgi:glycosyltransferase involved in cell wall biosynthesis